LALTPDDAEVFVVNVQDASVSVIRTADLSVTATIPIGNDAGGIAIHPTGSFASISGGCDARVQVTRTTRATNSAALPVASEARLPRRIRL